MLAETGGDVADAGLLIGDDAFAGPNCWGKKGFGADAADACPLPVLG